MINFNVKLLVVALGLSVLSMSASAQVIISKAALNNSDSATVSIVHPTPVKGDLYLVTPINGKLMFFGNQGKSVSDKVEPYLKNTTFNGSLELFGVSALGVAPGTYTIFEVITTPSGDFLNPSQWQGGLSGLYRADVKINSSSTPAPVTKP